MRTLMLVLLGIAGAAAVQSADVEGRWRVTLEAASRRTEDGGSIARRAFTGTLTVDLKGSAAAATLQLTGPVAGGEAIALRGDYQDARLRLASEWREASGSNNGKPMSARVRWVLDATLKGDELHGTGRVEFGESERLDQRLTAVRVR